MLTTVCCSIAPILTYWNIPVYGGIMHLFQHVRIGVRKQKGPVLTGPFHAYIYILLSYFLIFSSGIPYLASGCFIQYPASRVQHLFLRSSPKPPVSSLRLCYSYRNDSTGFDLAARMAWKLTVKSAISRAAIPAMKNIQRAMFIRYANWCSHRFMK